MGMKASILSIVLVGSLTGLVAAVPKPASAVRSWQLEFQFHDPARISVTLPGDVQPTTYWYLLYTVLNNTGQEVDFLPTIDLVTDTMRVVEGGGGIHPEVYEAIKARHQRQYPFFVLPSQAYGTLRQGEDNRRTSAIAFRDFDPEASSFVAYVAGLSGEMARVANPAFDPDRAESDKNRRAFVLRKTLAVTYLLPGDPESRNLTLPIRAKREWMMR